jgi:hypothetical protein
MEDIGKHRVGHPARCCHIISSRLLGHGCVERVEELEQRSADQVSGTVSTGQDEFVAPP